MDATTRAPAGRSAEKKTFYVKVTEFIRKFRVVLIAVLAGIVLAVAAIAIVSAIKDSSVNASAAKAEKLLEDYSAYTGQSDAAKKAELEKALIASADEIVAKWPRLFAAQRALSVKADVFESKNDWASAEKAWLAAVDSVPSSYLAPIALQRAATAAEEQGANERAADFYKRLIAKYEGATIGVPHAYFALGRLAELSKDWTAAMQDYQKIVSSWPDDDWTKLATDRIIALKSRGLAK
jgi:tetratricopeptide (TPR) repeat protein